MVDLGVYGFYLMRGVTHKDVISPSNEHQI